MNVLNKPNFYIFTGGPGAGKTTVLNALSTLHYTCIPEVARAIIKAQHASGDHALHTGDRAAYSALMLEHSIHDFITEAPKSDITFFDRGIPDLYSYMSQYCGGVTSTLQDAIQHYRYNTQVFLFPPWPEIYCHDAERKQSLDDAIQTYHSVKHAYNACGYTTLDVPKHTVDERINFILNMVTMHPSF